MKKKENEKKPSKIATKLDYLIKIGENVITKLDVLADILRGINEATTFIVLTNDILTRYWEKETGVSREEIQKELNKERKIEHKIN